MVAGGGVLVLLAGLAVLTEADVESQLQRISGQLEVLTSTMTSGRSSACSDDVQALVDRYNLVQTPVGTYFNFAYQSTAGQPSTNTIYELYPAGTKLPWVNANTTSQLFAWHHRGAALAMHTIRPDGTYHRHVLGDPLRHPQADFQLALGGDWWLAVEVLSHTEYVMFSGSAVPEFDRAAHVVGDPQLLATAFPQHRDIIMSMYEKP